MSTTTKARYIQDKEFAEVLANHKLVVVDYTAPWCGPCKAIAPLIDRLATDYQGKVDVVKIDIDENPENPKKYGIRSIPTILVFREGQVVETLIGKASYEIFSNALEKQLRL